MSAAGVRAWWAHYWPAGDGFDEQDRKIWAWHMVPSNSAPPDDFGSTFQQRQNYARSRWRVVANGSFDEQDRNHWAGFIQPGNSDAIHLQTFSVTYTLTPNFSIASTFAGAIDGLLGAVISALHSAGFDSFQPDWSIINDNATTEVPINYQICSRTGFRIAAHPKNRLIKDGYGDYVRIESHDPIQPQDNIASRGNDRQEGPQNAEASEDTFISTAVDPSEL